MIYSVFSLQLKRTGVELVVGAVLSHEFVVGAAFDDLPWSRTMTTLAFWMVESRWAMTKTVRPSMSASMPRWTRASVRVSMDEVASSRIITGGLLTAARAMERS